VLKKLKIMKKTIEVLLLKNLNSDDRKGQIIKVSSGFAKFLISQQFAVLKTKAHEQELDKVKEQKRQQEEQFHIQMTHLREQLEKVTLFFTLKKHHDKIFGAISSKEIIRKLFNEHQITIHKDVFTKFELLKSEGMHKLILKLSPKVIAILKVNLQIIDE
jgi:large subunit ribosomal protein L9